MKTNRIRTYEELSAYGALDAELGAGFTIMQKADVERDPVVRRSQTRIARCIEQLETTLKHFDIRMNQVTGRIHEPKKENER